MSLLNSYLLKVSILSISIILYSGCTGNVDNSHYKKEFSLYLSNELGLNLSDEMTFFYVIDLQSCFPCVKRNLNFLIDNEAIFIVPIFIGDSPNQEIQNKLKEIKKIGYKPIFDQTRTADFYELSLAKPLFISIENKIIKEYLIIYDNMTSLVLEKIIELKK